MPTLNWIGKDKVLTHHLDVPYKVLDHIYGFENGKQSDKETGSGNKIIHGDNLEALKSLLPEYEGRIKCIYIDPPYNTGNEGWIYNDNVNDPKMKKWLGQVVGKESEDLSRHDKWLCMMYPRLKLLHKLLADDGAIFISIDDNEQANLKLMCDEIFGAGNFIINVVWQKRYSRENRGIIGDAHEFLITYSKNYSLFKNKANKISPTEDQVKIYKNPNNSPQGRWRGIPMTAQGYRPNQMYPIQAPSGKIHLPPEGRCWSTIESEYQKLLKDGRIYFGKNNDSQPNIIRFLSEVEGFVPWSWWPSNEVGHTDEAKKEIYSFFGKTDSFDTPKPVRLLNRVFEIATDKDSIVLDSFSGSGTTAHAVINLNKQDGGNRKYILIEMEEYAETITSERVKRVINGYNGNEGTKGGFDFYRLGKPIFDEQGNLNADVPTSKIQAYIYHSETKKTFNNPKIKDSKHFLGVDDGTAYYLYYEPNDVTVVDYDFLSKIKIEAEKRVIYADKTTLTPGELSRYRVVFKKIPRDISRL